MDKDLKTLAAKYKTDKLEHGYIDFYEQHLPTNPKKILEIGVKEGRSLLMWKEYFPQAEIHGLDLFMEFPIPTLFTVDDNYFRFHKGHQSDYLLLEKLRNENFDVIIDDGSHNSRDQMITFFGLFNGKHYFIEDLHCNKDDFYSQGLPYYFSADGLFSRLSESLFTGENITLIQC